jgi:hypothetical protein
VAGSFLGNPSEQIATVLGSESVASSICRLLSERNGGRLAESQRVDNKTRPRCLSFGLLLTYSGLLYNEACVTNSQCGCLCSTHARATPYLPNERKRWRHYEKVARNGFRPDYEMGMGRRGARL